MEYPLDYKKQLSMIKGTTKAIHITITDNMGNPYEPSQGDVVRFGVKQHYDAPYLIKKETAEIGQGTAEILLRPEDTADVPAGSYFYDIGLQSAQDYYSVIPCSAFVLLPSITEKE